MCCRYTHFHLTAVWYITGSAVTLHCGKAHVQSQWGGANFDPRMTSKSLKFFKFELDIHDYVQEFYTSANFHFNPFSGASPQIGEILVL